MVLGIKRATRHKIFPLFIHFIILCNKCLTTNVLILQTAVNLELYTYVKLCHKIIKGSNYLQKLYALTLVAMPHNWLCWAGSERLSNMKAARSHLAIALPGEEPWLTV